MNKRKIPYITLTLIAINVVIFLLMLWQGIPFQAITLNSPKVLDWGANFNPFTLDGEGWRLLTSLFIHGGYVHIAVNMFALFSLGKGIEKEVTPLYFIALYFLCGLGAGITSLAWHIFTVSVGASGAIFGLYGYELIIQFIDEIKNKGKVIVLVIQFLIFVGINVFLGEYMNVDHAGHFGGLFTGVFIAFYKEFRRYSVKSFPIYLETTLIFGVLFTFVFWLLPRDQVDYYKAFQEVVQQEKVANQLISGNYPSDAVYLDSLRHGIPLWTETLEKVNALNDLPLELALDQQVLIQYCSLRREGIIQRINSLEKESYIYWDSIEVVNESVGALPGLRYILNYKEEVEQPKADSTEAQEVLIPSQVYYDKDWNETLSLVYAAYYRLGKKDTLGRWQGKVNDFYTDGSIQMKGYYEDNLKDGVFRYYRKDSTYDAAGVYKGEMKTGKWEYFHDNGQLNRKIYYDDRTYTLKVFDREGNQMVVEGNGTEIEKHDNDIIRLKGEYEEGLRRGLWYGYYPSGELHFEEYYENGRLVNGKSFDKQGEKYTYQTDDLYPNPATSYAKLNTYLNNQTLGDGQSAGKLTVIFAVDTDGTLSEFRFKDSPSLAIEQQVISLLQNGPKWNPAKEYGKTPFKAETLLTISYP